MRNPLNKRIPRELKEDFGKYFVIFSFMVLLISLVSGFLVATGSCQAGYYEGMDKYNVEHGHLTFNKKPSSDILNNLEEKGNVKLYDLKYINLSNEKGDKIRVYKNRKEVNLPCVMEGKLPSTDEEIVIDRLYAENNDYNIGDIITLANKDYKISGTVALPDYSVLFENNSDAMFNASNFSIALLTEKEFDKFSKDRVIENYSWRYKGNFDRYNKKESQDFSENFLEILKDVLTDYNEELIDEGIASGKLILLDEIFNEIEKSLAPLGLDLSIYPNEKLLDMVNEILEKENIDLSEKLDIEREISFTVDDIDLALKSSDEDIEKNNAFLDNLENSFITIDDYLPQYKNQAINFSIDDIGGDTAMFVMFDYLVTVVIAFVFAVTISNTIYSEASVIGTLRASGYTKRDLVFHYMTLPMLVTIIAGVIGNIIGYSYLKKYMAGLYYHSYSLGKYDTVWNMNAFIMTTIVPIILMFIINLVILNKKLSLSPIRFLRRDLTKKGKKKAFYLNEKLPFLSRFRLRVIFQNFSNYLTLAIGIFLGGVVIIFSTMFMPLLAEYKDMILDTRLSDYQYILKEDLDINKGEKFLITSLETDVEGFIEDEITLYGLDENSEFVKAVPEDEKVLLSTSFMKKYKLKNGDIISLKNPYTEREYEFEVGGEYNFKGNLSVFMNEETFINAFKKKDYTYGVFSDENLNIDEDKVSKTITVKDLTMMSDQLTDSMSNFMVVLKYFGIIMFLLLMYLLSKQIIEKNANSISMAKILGFKNKEIGSIYIIATSLVVIISLIAVCPLANLFLKYFFENFLYTKITGYIPYIIKKETFIQMIVLGLSCYAIVAFIQMIKINKISKVEVLKNVE